MPELIKKYLMAIDLFLLLLIQLLKLGFIAHIYAFIKLYQYNWITETSEYSLNYDINHAVYFQVAFNKYMKYY